MEKIKNVPKNDVLDLLEVGPLPAEANLQLADPELVSLYKRYSKRCIYLFDDIDDMTEEIYPGVRRLKSKKSEI